jgi:4-hydroxybenzoyl-CoA reductase subunit beta
MERIAPFAISRPATLAEAAALLASTPGARLLSGGTDLLPNLRDGLGEPPALVDLAGVAGISAVTVTADGVVLGAGVTLARMVSDTALRRALPVLAEAASMVAGPAHRTVATLGGNLCLETRCVFFNQSAWWRRANDFCLKYGGDVCHVAPQGKHCHAAFSGDLAPVLIALDAVVEIVGPTGARRIALADLYADDGAHHLTIGSGEIVATVRIPVQPTTARTGYRKARARGAIDFPLAGVAVRVEMDGGAPRALRVALTGTNSRPFLLDGTDAITGEPVTDEMLSKLGKLVQKQVSPMRTTATHSNYRRQVASVLAQRLVRELASAPPLRDAGSSA